jgi:hypothetical protein
MDPIPSFLFCCGMYYLQKRNFEQALYAFFIASRFHHPASIRELGVMLIRGQGTNIQLSEGARLLYEAERFGDNEATLILDSYLEI